jgi:hypothetical protein
MTLEVLRCPRHAKFWAVTVNSYRITPSKCCGAWWPSRAGDLA